MPAPSTTPSELDAVRRTIVGHLLLRGEGDDERSHDVYHDDAILEFPQSGERFIGVANFKEWRLQYPAEVTYRIRRISGAGEHWVLEVMVSYDGGPWVLGLSMIEFRGDKISRETIYTTEPWDAAEWRTPWVTKFDIHASVAPEDWRPDEPFGLEAELERTLHGAGTSI